jgi:NTP pyrophosphatase (non-canonical NTP hydrolase)
MNENNHLDYFANHPSLKGEARIPMTTDELFRSIEQWAMAKGLDDPKNKSSQALKVMEEVGETMAAMARGNKAALKDGIGDSIVTLIILAMQCGLSASDCLASAYNEIKDRKGKTVNGVFIKE